MSSTRRKSSALLYQVEKRNNQVRHDYVFGNSHNQNKSSILEKFSLPNSTRATINVNPSLLSNNATDIESYLRGINSVNLEGNSFKCTPSIKSLNTFKFYDRIPLLLPDQIKHDQRNRPLFN